ncbi:MAG: ribonuclease domain-containing protein [Firmicutes bacterium]|nr:ribonuclease domain-containing protein [Bacillota bacterium]
MKKRLPILLLLALLILAAAFGLPKWLEQPEVPDTTLHSASTAGTTATDPSAADPMVTEPSVTEPPATLPPETLPPATEPPVTEPPATQPPATQPPATQPPATQPPATQPPATQPTATEAPEPDLDPDGVYDSKEDVALYIHLYGRLPQNFITKNEAEQRYGWTGGSLDRVAPGMCIGGDRFGNREGRLPKKSGRYYMECDIDTIGASARGTKRIVFSNDGLVYYTEDHYQTFELLYGEP